LLELHLPSKPATKLTLPEKEVHLWSASLSQPAAVRELLATNLSPDEQTHAARFHTERHRNEYKVARGLLRAILSHYTGVAAPALQFQLGRRGKPALQSEIVSFNLSHSEDLVVYAISCQKEIGVDVEYVRPLNDLGVIAQKFFAAAEYQELLRLDETARLEGFFNCWTRKEAYVKAMGDGLYAPLDDFQVSLAPDSPASFVSSRTHFLLASEWSLFGIQPRAGYVGAVAVHGTGWQLRQGTLHLPAF